MPSFPVHLHELDRQYIFVDPPDLLNGIVHGEIFRDGPSQERPDKLPVIVLKIPGVESIIELIVLPFVFLLLELEHLLNIYKANLLEFFLQVFEELGRTLRISGCLTASRNATYIVNVSSVESNPAVNPSGVP